MEPPPLRCHGELAAEKRNLDARCVVTVRARCELAACWCGLATQKGGERTMPRAPVAMLGGAIGLVLFAGCETVEDVRGIERTTNRVRSPSTATTIGTSRCVCQAIGTRRASTPGMKNTTWSARGERTVATCTPTMTACAWRSAMRGRTCGSRAQRTSETASDHSRGAEAAPFGCGGLKPSAATRRFPSCHGHRRCGLRIERLTTAPGDAPRRATVLPPPRSRSSCRPATAKCRQA